MRLFLPVPYTLFKKLDAIIFFNIFLLCIGGLLRADAQAPVITSFSPATACQGQTVTITGTDLTDVKTVQLGTLAATNVTVVNATTVTAVVADDAASGIVSVTNSTSVTAIATGSLTVLTSPKPVLIDLGPGGRFTNCSGSASYELKVVNNSVVSGTGNTYQIDWGDGSAVFSQTDWAIGAQTSHIYNAQGYFPIVITITSPGNGCSKSSNYRFYNGLNPLASFTTTASTTGLCAPAPVEFQIGNWFNNSPGTTYVINFGDGTPNLVLSHPLDPSNIIYKFTHTYAISSCPGRNDFTATLDVTNGCFTTTYTLNQIIVRKKAAADFNTTAAPCISAPVCFTNTTIDGYGDNNSCSPASNFEWDFGDGTKSNLPNPPCHTYPAAGNYTVTLTATNFTCGSDVKTKVITVSPQSPPPTVTPVSYCRGASASPLTATGTGLRWYTTATGGTGSTTAPTPLTNTPGVTNYYVTQTIPGSCESTRVPLTVTVNALPGAPTVTSPLQLCLNQATVPLTATGTNLLWYTTATGGTGDPNAPTPSSAAVGTQTWWVSQRTNGCEGPRAQIIVNVNALAVAPAVTSPIVYCQNASAVPLTASGSGLLWYTVSSGGTGSSAAPTPSTVTPGSTTYYVSQVTGCGESPRSAITVNVNAMPNATINYTPAILCNTGNPPLAVTFSGTTGGTFSVTPGGLPINAGSGEITPDGANAGGYTIRYTIPASGGCPVYNATTNVTINSTPDARISYPAICTANPATAVTRTGSAGGTYSATPAGLAIDPANGTIDPGASTPGTYTVDYNIAAAPPCPGFSTSTTVTVTLAPSATIAYTPSLLCNVTGSPTVPVTHTGSTGGSYAILPAGLTINTATGELDPSNATPGVYTIRYTIPGAGGCADYITTASVTVNGTPYATITYPPICTADAAVSVNRTGNTGGVYSAPAGLTINAATGTITPGTSTPGTYTVSYEIAASAPCPGYTATTSVTVTQAPSATISYNPATLCNVINSATNPNLPVNVMLTGTTGGRYAIAPATGLQINAVTGQINPSGATAGAYTITYTVQGTGGCADFSTTTTVNVNSAPTATINYSGPYCGSTTAAQTVTFTGSPGGTFTASPAGLSINSATGAITPSASTPGVYTVTYEILPSAPCPGFTTTASVQIIESPVVTFPLPSQFICSGETAVYVPTSTVVNTSYTWTVITPLPPNVAGVTSGNSNGPISLSFTNTGTVNQTLTVRVIPINPTPAACAGAAYDLTIIVRPAVRAPVTDTANFCMDMPPTALQVTPLPGNTIKWYDQNLVLLNAAPVINPANPGMYKYFVSQVTGAGCESPRAEIVAVVHPTAKIISSGFTNPNTCGVPSGNIILNVLDLNNNALPNTPVIVHYTRLGIARTFAGSTDATGRIVIPLTAGTYTDISVETSGGCTSQPIPDVFILRDPTPPAAPVAGYNPPICSGTTLTLTALTATSAQAGPIDYVWAGPAFGPYADTIRNSVVTFPSAATSDAGTYVVYAMQNNCISLPASFQVVIMQAPTKPVISTRTPLCAGEDLSLQASSSIPGNAALNYLWKGPGPGLPVNSPNVSINNIKVENAGIYTITVTSPQTGCSSSTDTMIQVGDYPVVKFSQDTVIAPTGYRLDLVPEIINAASAGVMPMQNFTWTPAQNLTYNNAIRSSAIAEVKNNICYQVTATNIFGCSGSDDICIRVFCQQSQVFIPNAFAPTGNVPENRKLVVRGTGINSVKSFRVFNRWGRIVYERSNFPPNSTDFGWDGMVNGRMADTGVYVYTVEVICENGVPYTFKGNVTLL